MPNDIETAAQNTNDAAQTEVAATEEKTAAQAETAEPKQETSTETKSETAQAEEPAFDLKLPEGIQWDEGLKNNFVEMAKADGIKPETAQKLVDLHLKTMQDIVEKQRQTVDGWAQEAEKTFGDKKDEVLSAAAKGLAQFDKTGALRADLEATGLGNKKEWIDLFRALGAATKEGDFVEGNPAKGGSFLDELYPSMK